MKVSAVSATLINPPAVLSVEKRAWLHSQVDAVLEVEPYVRGSMHVSTIGLLIDVTHFPLRCRTFDGDPTNCSVAVSHGKACKFEKKMYNQKRRLLGLCRLSAMVSKRPIITSDNLKRELQSSENMQKHKATLVCPSAPISKAGERVPVELAARCNCSTGTALVHGWHVPKDLSERPRHQVWCEDKQTVSPFAVNPFRYGSDIARHHEVFSYFKPWRGIWPADGLIDFMGFKVDQPRSTYCNWAYARQRKPYVNRAIVCDLYSVLKPGTLVQLAWPAVSEEYFEYVDTLTSVREYVLSQATAISRRPYVIIELGAGYGHWSFAAHAALQQGMPGAPSYLLQVDVLSSLEPIVRRLGALNSVPPSSLHWHTGYVTGSSELSKNERQKAQLNVKVYEKVWLTGRGDNQTVPALSLAQLFRHHRVPCFIDMVDIDVQGAEYGRAVQRLGAHENDAESTTGLLNARTIALLTKRVRRVHIGLHGAEADDEALLRAFGTQGWRLNWYFPKGGGFPTNTSFGPVWFADGVASFTNYLLPKELSSC